MSDQDLVKSCLREICKKNGFEDPASMTQRNFELISSEIEESTGVLLSVSTIKRLLNGDFSRIPQTTTLNAIAAYLGFKNWQEYKISIQKSPTGNEEKRIVHPPKKYKIRVNWNWIGLAVIVFGIIVFFGFIKRSSKPASNYDKAQFSASKTTNNDIPNTVIFKYDLDKVNADSFFIQQSWDKRRRVKIDKNQHVFTDIYYEPGYHVAKLIANDSIIKTVDVSIPTDKWVYYAKERSGDNLPKYITVADKENKRLQISRENAINSLVNIEKENYYIMAYFPSRFESSSDNFILKCKVKVNEVRNNVCPSLMCEIFCQKNFMYFKSMRRGCSNEISAQFSENALYGSIADLSALAMDTKNWQDIEFIVRNKKATIKINNVERFSADYKVSAGLITGLGFISNGLCEVEFVELKEFDGKIIYQNNQEKEK